MWARKVTVISIVAVMALLLAACGGSDDDTSAEPTIEPTEVQAAPEPATPTATATPTPEPLAWTEVNADAPWAARAGLRVEHLGDKLYLMGGRTPNDSTIPGDSRLWGDVWTSSDSGQTWQQILETDDQAHWPARAYFQTVVKDDQIFVIGGQNYILEVNPFCELLEQGLEPPPELGIDPDAPCPEFLPSSEFFNDVWSSPDGVTWTQLTAAAPWEGRAGLSAAVLWDHIYVFAGSRNDDTSIIGPSGPPRIYYNDVWRSPDGSEWEQVTDSAPWSPRAGVAVVQKDGFLYLLGGEAGFTCEPLPDCEPPYFNDVWRTADGVEWEEVTAAAGWSGRPGQVCAELFEEIICLGGFGIPTVPTDMWASADGSLWRQLDDDPWNSTDPTEMKYDFAGIAVSDGPTGGPAILTFGGDRETFDFDDPENYLRVDNDVWSYEG